MTNRLVLGGDHPEKSDRSSVLGGASTALAILGRSKGKSGLVVAGRKGVAALTRRTCGVGGDVVARTADMSLAIKLQGDRELEENLDSIAGGNFTAYVACDFTGSSIGIAEPLRKAASVVADRIKKPFPTSSIRFMRFRGGGDEVRIGGEDVLSDSHVGTITWASTLNIGLKEIAEQADENKPPIIVVFGDAHSPEDEIFNSAVRKLNGMGATFVSVFWPTSSTDEDRDFFRKLGTPDEGLVERGAFFDCTGYDFNKSGVMDTFLEGVIAAVVDSRKEAIDILKSQGGNINERGALDVLASSILSKKSLPGLATKLRALAAFNT